MAIVIICYGVIVPIANIEKCKALGGFKSFIEKEKLSIGKKMLYDNFLFKDGAMDPYDVQTICKFWVQQGLTEFEYKDGEKCWKDLCVVDSLGGPTLSCDWLNYGIYKGSMCVWLKGTPKGNVIHPYSEVKKSVLEQLKMKQQKPIKILGEPIDQENFPILHRWAKRNLQTLESQLQSLADKWHEGSVGSAMAALESDMEHG